MRMSLPQKSDHKVSRRVRGNPSGERKRDDLKWSRPHQKRCATERRGTPELRPSKAILQSPESGADYITQPLVSGLSKALYRRDNGPNTAPSRLISSTGVEITRLLGIPGEDCRPDACAHACAHRMLIRLSDLGFEVSANDVYLDPDRAIRLLWRGDLRSVEMVFPSSSDENPYLYHSDDQAFGVEDNPSAEVLLDWLKWVLKDVSAGRPCAA